MFYHVQVVVKVRSSMKDQRNGVAEERVVDGMFSAVSDEVGGLTEGTATQLTSVWFLT